MSRPRLAVLCDYAEEGWPSMDLCADMLLQEVRADRHGPVTAERVCPPFRRRFGRVPWFGRRRAAFNADRLLNRFWDYPSRLRPHVRDFNLFHVCDHSYAHLVHALPAGRAGVYCHDLDAFRCLLEPSSEPRPVWFRAMARHILKGLEKAAVVFYSTNEVRRQIEARGLLDSARLVYAPYGVNPEYFLPEDDAPLPTDLRGCPYLLHVGSCIPRKRIDVLLDVFAAVRPQAPDLRLVQVGGPWTAAQREQIERLGVSDAVTQLRGLSRPQLAALYRRAALILQPSEAEGFGLPVVEALACGAIVVASDLPVLREVGGDAVVYRPVAGIPSWAEAVRRLLADPTAAPAREARLGHARHYSWPAQARTITSAYLRLLSGGAPAAG